LAVEIRRFVWTDIEGIARLHRAAEPFDRSGRLGDAIALRKRWSRPGNQPEAECLVAEALGKVVGYAYRFTVAGSAQCQVDGVVHPAWRRQGIGRQLLARTAEDARLSGAQSLDLRVRDDELAALAFCQAVGLRAVRVWHRQWLEPLRLSPFTFPAGYSWRQYRPRHDDAAYVKLVNETLGDHWGLGPITHENLASLVGQPGFEPANILFAIQGQEIVGVSALRLVARQVAGRDSTVAHIGPVGVQAAHRGLGLAHALLAASLRHCRRRRIQAAELDVDETNAPAIHVYQDCGFETLFRILWYRQELG